MQLLWRVAGQPLPQLTKDSLKILGSIGSTATTVEDVAKCPKVKAYITEVGWLNCSVPPPVNHIVVGLIIIQSLSRWSVLSYKHYCFIVQSLSWKGFTFYHSLLCRGSRKQTHLPCPMPLASRSSIFSPLTSGLQVFCSFVEFCPSWSYWNNWLLTSIISFISVLLFD